MRESEGGLLLPTYPKGEARLKSARGHFSSPLLYFMARHVAAQTRAKIVPLFGIPALAK